MSLSHAAVWNTIERDVCRAVSFGNLFFLLWIEFFFYSKAQFLSSLNNRGVSLSRAWFVLLTGMSMNVMFARAVSFGDLFFLLWIDFFYAKTQRKVRSTIEVCPWLVLLSEMSMNVMFVRTLSFDNLFFLL